jgi:hypothetical protein
MLSAACNLRLFGCAAKGSSAAAGGAKVTADDGWAADGRELGKLKGDSPYDALRGGATLFDGLQYRTTVEIVPDVLFCGV